MATQIGVIKTIAGTVTATMPNGQQRNLQQNDIVFQDEVIMTAETGTVEILLNDGSTIDLGKNANITLEPISITADVAADDVATIQQAILEGEDPTQNNEPATAGPEAIASDEGTNIVQVAHLAPETTPTSGFDTTGIDFAFPENIERLGDDLPTPDTNGTPSIRITPDSVNDTAYSFTVTNHDEVSSAGFNNSYGYYIKDSNGNPTTGLVIWDDVHDRDAITETIITEFPPEQVGFFIIPNGDNQNPSLTDNTEVTFQFVNGEWQAFNNGQPLTGRGSHVLFDNANLNKDGQDHVQDNALIGNQNWEDLQIPNGDGDFNDVNVNVVWSNVKAIGDSIESLSFGEDGPGSINFSLEEVTIMGTLTSNGKAVTFEARDSDSDGQNDLIVGKTEDGDVLSIEGILEPAEFDLELFAPLDSSNNGNNDVEITTNLSITDSDGDSVFTTLNFNLDINQITETTASTTVEL